MFKQRKAEFTMEETPAIFPEAGSPYRSSTKQMDSCFVLRW